MNRLNRVIVSLAVLIMWAATARAETLVIEGGTVHTMTGAPFVGRVVIANGVIVGVGPDATVPPDAKRINAAGLHVYPGLCDAMCTLGLIEVDAVSATNDQAEMGMYNPHLDAATAIHPASEVIPVTRANGVTHALVSPRAAREGVITGQATLVNLDGWTVEEMAIDASAALVINWPGIVTRRFDSTTFSFKETPYEDAKEEAKKRQNELREWVEAARHYRQAKGAEHSRAGADQKLAALAACLEGKKPVVIQADSKRDIEAAIAFADEAGLTMILAGGAEAWKVKETLAEKKIPVILARTQSLPREEDDPYDRPYSNPAMLREAGVRIAFASGAGGGGGGGSGAHSSRTIPYEAAMATGYGLSEEDAMKALTVWPAEIFGVADRLGSLEAGKAANVIVTDGSPLEITSNVRHLIIAGREISTDNKHEASYEKYSSRPHRHPGSTAASRP
ncbi:MAG TPA: amidohydrolase family protein [Candidatus Krumholzibacteria bacterium]|nr:amidohydrolase family protein [Candidatus Krumholzibacteria bacterium]